MRITRPKVVLAAVAVNLVVATVAAALMRTVVVPGDALAADELSFVEGDNRYYDQLYTYAIGPFANTSRQALRLHDARFVDPSPGLVIDSIEAVNLCDGSSTLVVAGEGPVHQDFPNVRTHPVRGVVIAPRARRACWYLLATVHAERAGTYEARHIDVEYRIGWRTRTQRFEHGFQFGAHQAGPAPR